MTDTSGLKFDSVTRFIVSASGKHGAEYNREYERVYKIIADFALQQAKEHHQTTTVALKLIREEHKASVADLVEALTDAVSHVAGSRIGHFGDHTAHCDITVRPERLQRWTAALKEFK